MACGIDREGREIQLEKRVEGENLVLEYVCPCCDVRQSTRVTFADLYDPEKLNEFGCSDCTGTFKFSLLTQIDVSGYYKD